MKEIILITAVSFSSIAYSSDKAFYDDKKINEMLEALGYMSFQKSFLSTCGTRYPDLSTGIDKSLQKLEPYFEQLEHLFTNQTVPQELKEAYLYDDYEEHTNKLVENDFATGKYAKENCKFAVWSIHEEGIDPAIETYLNKKGAQ